MAQNDAKLSLVEKTRNVFKTNVTRTLAFRLAQLKGFLRFLEENEENLIKTIHQDLRKHRQEVRVEILVAINHLRYLIRNVKSWTSPEKPGKRLVDFLDGVYVYNEPYGVVLVMGTWNVPLMTLLPAAGAMSAGNCVVIKPSHLSPNFGEMLAALLPLYIDSSCYPVYLGDIERTTRLLGERFDYIYYTGSTSVGRIVHSAANRFLTPVTLELGGKNPVFLDDTADFKMAATRIMWGKCVMSGQACVAPDYVLCTSEQVRRDFVKFAKMALDEFGEDFRKLPIVNGRHFERLKGLMNGLRIEVGGGCDVNDLTIEPTLAIDVTIDDEVMKQEIFGPILPLIVVKNKEDAVDFINNKMNDKALAMYIFTKDTKTRDFLLANTSTGGVTVNDTLMHLLVESLPFGGIGNSGMGRYKGKDSFDTFVHKRSVLIKNCWPIAEKVQALRYPPYTESKTNLMALLIRSRGGLEWSSLYYFFIFVLGLLCGFLIFYFTMN